MKKKTILQTVQIEAPLTGAEKQRRRSKALKEIAVSAGYSSWSQYCTSVINGEVAIQKRGAKNGK